MESVQMNFSRHATLALAACTVLATTGVAAHAQTVLSRDQLLDLAKGRSAIVFDRSIDIQVSRLRRKLGDDAKEPKIIKTVWGGGYMFTPDVTTE